MNRTFINFIIRHVVLLCVFGLFVGFASAEEPTASERNLFPANLILQWTHQAQFAGYYMALEKGFYAEEGIDMTILRGGPDRDAMDYLVSGRADFATLWLVSALEAESNGVSLKHLVQIVNRSNLILMTWKDKGVETVKDLDGRRVGLWEGMFRPPFIAFFQANNVSPEIIRQNYSINLFLTRGVVACSAMYYNEYHMLYQAGVDYDELQVFSLASEKRPFPEDGVYCLRGTFDENPEICRGMGLASLKGWVYAAKHQEETLDVVMRYVAECKVPTNREHMRWMLDAMLASIFPENRNDWFMGSLSPKAYDNTVEMMLEAGMIEDAPAFDEFIAGGPLDVP